MPRQPAATLEQYRILMTSSFVITLSLNGRSIETVRPGLKWKAGCEWIIDPQYCCCPRRVLHNRQNQNTLKIFWKPNMISTWHTLNPITTYFVLQMSMSYHFNFKLKVKRCAGHTVGAVVKSSVKQWDVRHQLKVGNILAILSTQLCSFPSSAWFSSHNTFN